MTCKMTYSDKTVLWRHYIVHMSVVCESIMWKQLKIEILPDDSWKPADSVLFTNCSCHWPVAVDELNLSLTERNEPPCYLRSPHIYELYLKHKIISLSTLFSKVLNTSNGALFMGIDNHVAFCKIPLTKLSKDIQIKLSFNTKHIQNRQINIFWSREVKCLYKDKQALSYPLKQQETSVCA